MAVWRAQRDTARYKALGSTVLYQIKGTSLATGVQMDGLQIRLSASDLDGKIRSFAPVKSFEETLTVADPG
jgi:hypothetical protein